MGFSKDWYFRKAAPDLMVSVHRRCNDEFSGSALKELSLKGIEEADNQNTIVIHYYY